MPPINMNEDSSKWFLPLLESAKEKAGSRAALARDPGPWAGCTYDFKKNAVNLLAIYMEIKRNNRSVELVDSMTGKKLGQYSYFTGISLE